MVYDLHLCDRNNILQFHQYTSDEITNTEQTQSAYGSNKNIYMFKPIEIINNLKILI